MQQAASPAAPAAAPPACASVSVRHIVCIMEPGQLQCVALPLAQPAAATQRRDATRCLAWHRGRRLAVHYVHNGFITCKSGRSACAQAVRTCGQEPVCYELTFP